MAKITRIKAKDPGEKPQEKALEASQATTKVKVAPDSDLAKKSPDLSSHKVKNIKNEPKKASSQKKPFILIRPFVAFGHYVHDSWLEIRQVRWPSRKSTWKMVAAIFIYTGLFIAIIMLLDALFTWIFGLILG